MLTRLQHGLQPHRRVLYFARVRAAAILILSLTTTNPGYATEADSANVSPSPAPSPSGSLPFSQRTYPLVRADEDWRFLSDPANRVDAFDTLEYVTLRPGQPDWYASFGGEVREVYESIGSDLWKPVPPENESLQQRYLLVNDFHLGRMFRVFLELKSNLEGGRTGPPRPIDVDRFDLLGGFVQANLGRGPASPSIRIGREELSLGSGRLIAPREGPNVRQSFTGVRAQSTIGTIHLDALDVHPDADNSGIFDDSTKQSVGLWGLYGSSAIGRTGFDAYYLGVYRQQEAIARGTADEHRQTLGLRAYRPFRAAATGFDMDNELMYQFGAFGSHPIVAWSVATQVGWHFGPSPRSPHFLLRADEASGDDPRSRAVGTFDPYFPIGNYFGVLATTGPGPANFNDVHPAVSTILGPVTLTGDWLWYWRHSTLDGLYGVPGNLLRPPIGSASRFVGQRPGIEVRWQIDAHAYLQSDYGVFSSGPFIHDTGPASSLVYRSVWLGYKF